MADGERSGTAQRLQRTARAARRAQDGAKDAEAARDAAIGDAEGEGWSYGDIAKACELSKAHVHRICVWQAAARQPQIESD